MSRLSFSGRDFVEISYGVGCANTIANLYMNTATEITTTGQRWFCEGAGSRTRTCGQSPFGVGPSSLGKDFGSDGLAVSPKIPKFSA